MCRWSGLRYIRICGWQNKSQTLNNLIIRIVINLRMGTVYGGMTEKGLLCELSIFLKTIFCTSFADICAGLTVWWCCCDKYKRPKSPVRDLCCAQNDCPYMNERALETRKSFVFKSIIRYCIYGTLFCVCDDDWSSIKYHMWRSWCWHWHPLLNNCEKLKILFSAYSYNTFSPIVLIFQFFIFHSVF